MRSTRIIITAFVAAFVAAAIALLENVLTNEKHPEHSVVYGLVALVVLFAAGQAIGGILSARKDDQSAKEIRNIKTDTQEILETQKAVIQDSDERKVDQILTKFPYALRDFIKAQWKNSPEEVLQVIEAVSEPASRPAAVLTEWEQSLPGWMASANWRAVTVAAELAQAYGVNQLASELFLKAASDSTRAHYWTARASILIYMHGDKQKAAQVLTDRTIDIQSPDLFARIVFCLVTDDRTACQMLLEQWTPDQPIDIFLSGAVQIQLLIDYSRPPGVISDEDWIKAIRIYRQLINKLPQSAALRIGLASSLINLVSNGQSTDRHRDLNEALENAIIARDISREIFASSVQAVEVACQAAYSDMQFRCVIKLGTTINGEATAEEACSDIVRASVTTAALLTGQTEMADRLILEINDTFRKSILVAMSAEVDGKPLANLWVAALQQARDAYERAQALLGLARMGLAESEQIDNLSHDLPKEAALIRAVSEAATGNLAVAIRQLRSIQDSDISTVTALADVYLKSGNASAAADTLREGARIFNEPRLRIEAARLLSENNDHNAAVVELEQLLVDSVGNAVVQRDCLGILAEWSAERGDWSTAQRRYREVLALDPSDYKARWALILSLLQLGLLRDARRIYDEAPTTPEIILPFHARAWMATRLATDRADAVRFVDEVINIAQRFPDDENVQAEAIFTVLSPDSRRSDPLPSATQARFDRLFYHFTETWPESSRLRAYKADDVQDLVSQMDELVRPTQDEKRLRAEIAGQLARNVLPWATLSAITARSYSEIVITRAAGVLPAQSSDSTETRMCRSAATAAINKSVVLDISAAATLIEIPGISSLLVSQFERIMISEQERLDAINAEFQLRNRSTESWVYDEQSDRGRIATITTEAADERHRKAEALLDLISRFKVTPVGASERTAQLGDLANSTWITTIECAAQSNVAMWCDDVALRAAARSIGVSVFSTPSLIDVLIQTDVLTADQREVATRTFIEEFIGDFPLDPVRLSVLVAKHDGGATPVATVFARTSAWTNFKYAYETWCTLVHQSANVDRRFASDWLYYAILGAARYHQDAQCREIAAIILSAASSYIAEDPMQISRCVAAARSALVSLGRDSAQVDPLGRAVVVLRESLARIIGIVDATSYVSRAFSNLQADDRQIVLRALYA